MTQNLVNMDIIERGIQVPITLHPKLCEATKNGVKESCKPLEEIKRS